ncbi:MAG: PKD domain-containing protein [Chloroflexota bacterium]
MTDLFDYLEILPDFYKLRDFAVVDMDGEDWVYFTYFNENEEGKIAVARPTWPVAELTAVNDSPTELGQSTQFTATVSNGSNVSYTWNFGDGSGGNGATPAHTYVAEVGSYTAVVTASNDVNTLTATTEVIVTSTPTGYAVFPPY